MTSKKQRLVILHALQWLDLTIEGAKAGIKEIETEFPEFKKGNVPEDLWDEQ